MSKTTRLIKSIVRLVLPVAVFVVTMIMAASIWLVHSTSIPPRNDYLVTPEVYGRLSAHAAQVTDEKWKNRDGTSARGWLLRGKKGAPAVILLHKYGADRSYVLNLGVKISEATDFTVLMPDQRGHGLNPPVTYSTFGGCEVEDTLAAIDFLRGLRSGGDNLVGEDIGIYGLEMGALAGLSTAAKDQSVKALVLDSIPAKSNQLIDTVINKRYPFVSYVTSEMAKGGTYLYFTSGCYQRKSICEVARAVSGRNVLLLSGSDVPALKTSTEALAGCFPSNTRAQSFTDMQNSGFDIVNVSPEKADTYDQRVIYFFQENLKSPFSHEDPEEEEVPEAPSQPVAD